MGSKRAVVAKLYEKSRPSLLLASAVSLLGACSGVPADTTQLHSGTVSEPLAYYDDMAAPAAETRRGTAGSAANSKPASSTTTRTLDTKTMIALRMANPGVSPRILRPRRPLQCVPYARKVSGIAIRGDAHTWWRSAENRYRRGKTPAVGAVIVLKGNRKTRRGHLAVVTRVLNRREIVVDHANWLNRERIHLSTPVIDVSRNNDWSAVRVWYTPGKRYGASVYPVRGFIYPEKPSLFKTVANANIRQKPSKAAQRVATLPRETAIEVLEKVNGAPWYRVGQRGRVLGYVYAPLIAPAT